MHEQPLRLPVGASDPVEGLDVAVLMPGGTERIEWLIDASGLLHSTWFSFGTVHADLADDEVFKEAIRALQQPASPRRTTGHAHH
jgi:hypothetical protein